MSEPTATALIDRLDRIEELVGRAGEEARELVGAVLALHREALARVVEHLPGSVYRDDPAVAALLTLHGLHPDPIDDRIERAVAAARARLGRGCELAPPARDGDRVRVRVTAGPAAPPAPAIRRAIEEALLETAPDLAAVDVVVFDAEGRCSLPVLGAAPPPAHRLRCEVCGAPLPEHHGHRTAGRARAPQCACERCAEAAPPAVDVAVADDAWDALDVPVGLALFLRSSGSRDVLALYPGPAGLTEASVAEPTWQRAVERSPDLGRLVPDELALIVDRRVGRRRHRIVPVADAYRLAGTLRGVWRGLHGGAAVEAELERFFMEAG